MSDRYRLVQWNQRKRIYDLVVAGWVLVMIAGLMLLTSVLFPPPESFSAPVLLIRSTGLCAIVMLHFILAIGPLARMTPRMNIVLFNRRHLGVAFFFVALVHAVAVVVYYGGAGAQNPVVAALGGGRTSGPPFELYGFLALLIFALMAATSHDFWLNNLGVGFWKFMHMGVYIAYALVLAHVIFGVLRDERNIVYPALLSCGAVTLVGLHLWAGLREVGRDHRSSVAGVATIDDRRWYEVCGVDDIPPGRAKVVQLHTRERIAVFRDGGTLSAVSGVCPHQGGPLGEGEIIDGCITCPWHGHRFDARTGRAPEPYTDRVETYDVRIVGRRVLLAPEPRQPGRGRSASLSPRREEGGDA